MSDGPQLSLQQVEFSYDQSIILRGIDLEVPRKKLVCLMGRNGFGKTTTLKTSVGLLRPGRGRVLLDGEDVTALPPEERARKGVGYVPRAATSSRP